MIQVDTDNSMGMLLGWFRSCMTRLYGGIPGKGTGVVLACPIWGSEFVDRFGKYCLASLCAPRNLAALRNRCRIVIFTDAASAPRLTEYLQPLELCGFDIVFWEIPPPIMEKLTKNGRHYWLLGAVHNLAVQMCRRWGMALHMLQPDHIYPEAYWEHAFRIQGDVDCIAQTGISANIDTLAPYLEKYRPTDGELIIPDKDLVTLGYQHLHKQMQMYRMNDCRIPDKMPNSHFMFWQARDKLMIYCCHMNPAWLSAALCSTIPAPVNDPGALASTLDTRLPFIVTDGARLYIPGVEEGMGFIELSGDEKPSAPGFVGGLQFCAAAWGQVSFFPAYLPYFEQVCELPIHEQETFIKETDVIKQHRKVMTLLKKHKGEAAIWRWQQASILRRTAR